MKKTKQLAALRLNRQGVPNAKIAAKLGVSIRTIQRWILAEAPPPIDEAQIQALVASEGFKPESGLSSQLAATDDSEDFDEGRARKTALRLMKLSEAAIGVLEDCLSNPYAKQGDKLKAAQIVGSWLGLGESPQNSISITERVERSFAVSFEADEGEEDSEDSEDSEDDEEPDSGSIVTTTVIEVPPPPEAFDWMRQEEAKHREEIEQRSLAISLRARLGNPPRVVQEPENLA